MNVLNADQIGCHIFFKLFTYILL